MRITKENISVIPEKEQALVKALLLDLDEINKKSSKDIHLDWQEYHNEYSPERVDPCPDYYGMYRLIREEMIGLEMDIDTLDSALCLLHNYLYF